jgi:glycosyltransferase involved in cell wall biosynthesis
LTPAVTLVIPFYNREGYLGPAIASVQAQSRSDFELILWDDGSTDGSLEMARRHAAEDPRLRVVAAPHRGQTPSLRDALTQARGRYVGWVDSDDLLAPGALAATTAVLDAEPAVGLVYTSYATIDAAGQVTGHGLRCQIPYSPDRLLVDFMLFHFRLLRRSVYERVGGLDEAFARAQDYELCLRLAEVTEIRHVPKVLYYHRVHDGSVSNAEQVQQILCCKEAVTRALARRGLAGRVELHVQILSRFELRPRG